MDKWYNSIEVDGKFASDFIPAYEGYNGRIENHPAFYKVIGNPYVSSNTTAYGQRQILRTGEKEHLKAAEMIGQTLFLALMEYNPVFAAKLIGMVIDRAHHSYHLSRAEAEYEVMTRGFSPESSFEKEHNQPKNDDYTFWWEFDASDSAAIVTCDLWDENSSEFIAEFPFDPEDEADKISACEDAEKLVRKLSSGEIQMSRYITDVPKNTITIEDLHGIATNAPSHHNPMFIDPITPYITTGKTDISRLKWYANFGTTISDDPLGLVKTNIV